MGIDPLVGEGPRGVSPPVDAADGGHGPQTSSTQDMDLTTHWGRSGSGGTGGYWDIYFPSPEYGPAIHCDLSYHGLVLGGGAEAGNATTQAMVRASCPEYHRDKDVTGIRAGERGYGGGIIGGGGRGIVGGEGGLKT